MFFDWHKITLAKKVLILFTVFAIVVIGVFAFNFYFSNSDNNLSNESETGSIVSSPPKGSSAQSSEPGTVSIASILSADRESLTKQLAGDICDVFVTMPDKEEKFFKTMDCTDLDNIELVQDELFEFLGHQLGDYIITVFSDKIRQGVSFSLTIE